MNEEQEEDHGVTGIPDPKDSVEPVQFANMVEVERERGIDTLANAITPTIRFRLSLRVAPDDPGENSYGERETADEREAEDVYR